MQLVSAAVCLILQSQEHALVSTDDWRRDIHRCIDYLRAISSWNAVAHRGADILQTLLTNSEELTIDSFGHAFADSTMLLRGDNAATNW